MKRAGLLVMAGMLVMSFTGCSVGSDIDDGSSVMQPIEQNTEQSADNEQNTDGEQTVENNSDAAAGDALEAFIAGENTLSFKYYKDNVFVDSQYLSYEDETISHIPTDKEYTLSELKDTLNEIFHDSNNFYAPGDVEGMKYAYLDCGADGVKELALSITGPFVEPESDMTYIIKEIDSKLEVVYAFASWSRSESNVNEYGLVTGGGSGGATIHGYSTGYVDADGKYQYGFYEEEQADVQEFAYNIEHDEFDTAGAAEDICVYSLRLTPTSQGDYTPEFYSYTAFDYDANKEIEDPNLYTDSPYKTVMDSFKGITFITMDELHKKEDEKLASIGVTDQIKNGGPIEFKDIQ